MHIAEERFFTIHVKPWEAAQMTAEASTIPVDWDDYPALGALLGGLDNVAEDGHANVVDEIDVPETPPEPRLVLELEPEEDE